MRSLSKALGLLLLLASPAAAALPELPRVYVDTSMPNLSGATIKTVCASACDFTSINTAVNDASVKSAGVAVVIVSITAGQTFTGTVTLPVHNNGWVILQSSALASLPSAGTRVGTGDRGNMPTLSTAISQEALNCVDGAHHYRLIGLAITLDPAVTNITNLVTLGVGSGQTTLAQVPHHLIIDRSSLYGRVGTNLVRGIYLNSGTTAIIDSDIREIHANGNDSQTFDAINGPGPYKIVNNYLSASGEVVMFGGGDPQITNQVPSDIEFRRNYLFKPLTWNPADPSYDGSSWTVKNLLELKNAQRVLVDGNVMENNWYGAQNGYGILMTVRNQSGGAPWSVVQDITFTNNIIRNSVAGFNITGADSGESSQQTTRILIKNNLVDALGSDTIGATMFQLLAVTVGIVDLVIDHNTGFPGFLTFGLDGANSGVTITNNIFGYGTAGVNSYDGHGSGAGAISNDLPSVSFLKNLFVGVADPGGYPATTLFEPTMAGVGFVDLAAHNYQLTGGSAYHNAGTDGTDIGVNFATLNAAQNGLVPVIIQGATTLGGKIAVQ